MVSADSKGSITLNSIVYHDPDMVTAPMDDELVMFSLDRGMYYGLDNIASQIWARIAEPILVSDLCMSLLQDFEVEPDVCQKDTLELLNWLYQQKLVKIG